MQWLCAAIDELPERMRSLLRGAADLLVGVMTACSVHKITRAAPIGGVLVICALIHSGLAASPPPIPADGDAATSPPTDAATAPTALPEIEKWAVHGQSTFTEFYQPGFRSPYRGAQSLDPGSRGRETWDVTLYGGVQPWRGAELWVNPEVDQGFGPSNTFGAAGYPTAEAYKLGSATPYVRLQRLFLRQTVSLSGEVQGIKPDLNQLGGVQTENRVVITAGKFSSFDVFDTNKYAHDTRNDFLNWSLLDAGNFDQAGDAWGFSYGVAAEWYQDWWTIRGGLFDMPTVPTYKYLDTHFGRQLQYLTELEERHSLWGRDGKVKVSAFLSHGLFGSYAQAVALGEATGTVPDIQAVRRIRNKGGFSINVEQAITADLGLFLRAGLSDGTSSITSYTDIDNTVSFGVSVAGTGWSRPDDTLAVGFARNDISRHFKNYLNAGGLGILIGDGKLPNSAPEHAIETYYSIALHQGINVTADYQLIVNPAYNRDRGPANFFGLRLHAQI